MIGYQPVYEIFLCKVPNFLAFKVLCIDVSTCFIMIYYMTDLLDPNASHTIFVLSLRFQWYMFFGEATNKAAYETHKERLSVLAFWLLAVALSLGTRVVSAKRTCDIIPVLKAHPVEGMAAKYSQGEIINAILSHLCHLILLSW